MANASKDDGVVLALLKRFETQRLPRALALKDKVDSGALLSEPDIDFLQQVFDDARYIEPLLQSKPEWQPLVAKAIHLYAEIMKKATMNEEAAISGKSSQK